MTKSSLFSQCVLCTSTTVVVASLPFYADNLEYEVQLKWKSRSKKLKGFFNWKGRYLENHHCHRYFVECVSSTSIF